MEEEAASGWTALGPELRQTPALENALPCLQGRDLDPALENELILGTYDRAPLVLAHKRWDCSQPGLGVPAGRYSTCSASMTTLASPTAGRCSCGHPTKTGIPGATSCGLVPRVCVDAGVNVTGFELGLRTPWLSCGRVAASLTLAFPLSNAGIERGLSRGFIGKTKRDSAFPGPGPSHIQGGSCLRSRGALHDPGICGNQVTGLLCNRLSQGYMKRVSRGRATTF